MIGNIANQQIEQQKQKQYQGVPANFTANELTQIHDNRSVGSNQNLPAVPEQQQAVSNGLSKKTKIMILVGSALAFLLIFGVLLGILIVNVQQKNQFNDSELQIKTPPQYAEFQKVIDQGQKDNLLKLRHVPRSQLTYIYKLDNNQTTAQNGKQAESNTQIEHKISLICTNVSEQNFEMILYFQKTTIYQQGKVVGEFKGLLDMIEQEKKSTKGRNLQNQESDKQNNNNNNNNQQSSHNIEQMKNEYSPLNDFEKKILQNAGINEEEFNYSNYPLVKFILSKDGSIEKVLLPLNLRHDIYQIYLSILEQIIPRLSSDIYDITNNKSGQRVLTQRKRVLTIRNLASEDVSPKMQATYDSDNKASLQSTYATDRQFDNDAYQQTNYDQTQVVEVTGLVKTEVKSSFVIASSQTKKENQLFEAIDFSTKCSITFDSQIFDVGQEFLDQLEKTQKKMSRLIFTWEQALQNYEELNNNSKEFQNQNQHQRNLQTNSTTSAKKLMGEPVVKDLYQYDMGPLQFKSFLQTQCYQADANEKDDLCKVIVGIQVGQQKYNALDQDVKFNVSKLIKYYEYIVYLLDNKLGNLNQTLEPKLANLKKAIETILNKIEEFVDFNRNPLLKELNPIITDDQLGIFQLISDVEKIIVETLRNVNELVANPLQTLQNRSVAFLEERNYKLHTYINQIKDFSIEKYGQIMKFVEEYKTNGISPQLVGMIKSSINQYDDKLKQLIEKQVQQLTSQTQDLIKQKAKEFVDTKALIEKAEKLVEDKFGTLIGQQVKDFIIAQGIQSKVDQTFEDLLNKSIEKSNAANLVSQLASTQIFELREKLIKKLEEKAGLQLSLDNIPDQKTLDGALEQIKNIDNIIPSNYLLEGFDAFKENVEKSIGELKELFGKDVKKNLIEYSTKIIGIPDKITVEAYEKAKQVVSKVVEKAKAIDSSIVTWAKETKEASAIILNEVRVLFNELKEVIQNAQIPSDEQLKQKQSTFAYDDVQQVFTKVTQFFQLAQNSTGVAKDIIQQVKRAKDLPVKFQALINELKGFGLKAFDRYINIKTSVLNVSKEGVALYNTIVEQVKNAKAKFAQQQASRRNLQISLDMFASQFQSFSQNFQAYGDLLQLVQPVMEGNKQEVIRILKEKVIQMGQTLEFRREGIKINPIKLSKNFDFFIPTAIGINVKIGIGIDSVTQLGLDLIFSKGKLDLTGRANTQLTLQGSVAGDLYIVSVGGYAQGKVFDADIELLTNFEVFNKFKGGLELYLTLNPMVFKLGIYYESVFNVEGFKCFVNKKLVNDQKRQLGFFNQAGQWFEDRFEDVKDGFENMGDLLVSVKNRVKILAKLFGNATEKTKKFMQELTWEQFQDIAKCVINNVTTSNKYDLITPIEKSIPVMPKKQIAQVQWNNFY